LQRPLKYRIIAFLLNNFLRPLLLPLAALIKGIYWLFLGWWLDPKLHRKIHEYLVNDVHKWLAFLFIDYGASITPNQKEPPARFDFALVTLSVGDLIFQIFRGRGDVTLSVASVQKSK